MENYSTQKNVNNEQQMAEQPKEDLYWPINKSNETPYISNKNLEIKFLIDSNTTKPFAFYRNLNISSLILIYFYFQTSMWNPKFCNKITIDNIN